MGGPLSLLAWNIGFDPVVWGTVLAACCEALAYVDDLLANVHGPGHLLLTYLTLLAATYKACLAIEDHVCVCANNSHTRENRSSSVLRSFSYGSH